MVSQVSVGFLLGYLLYQIFRHYITPFHRLLYGVIVSVMAFLFFGSTLYFITLYRDFPGYVDISVSALTLVVGFGIGYCIDKLSDYYINLKRK